MQLMMQIVGGLLSPWIDQIRLQTLLRFAPFGFLAGCGETSEYLAYACQIQPQSEEELFNRLNRQGEYQNAQVDEVMFALTDIQDSLNEIETRLKQKGYVRVSFMSAEKSESMSMREAIFRKPAPRLFDHSFLMLQHKDVLRLESYIDQYAPRMVTWNEWRADLLKLVENPMQEWQRIFEVECIPCEQFTNVEIVISN